MEMHNMASNTYSSGSLITAHWFLWLVANHQVGGSSGLGCRAPECIGTYDNRLVPTPAGGAGGRSVSLRLARFTFSLIFKSLLHRFLHPQNGEKAALGGKRWNCGETLRPLPWQSYGSSSEDRETGLRNCDYTVMWPMYQDPSDVTELGHMGGSQPLISLFAQITLQSAGCGPVSCYVLCTRFFDDVDF